MVAWLPLFTGILGVFAGRGTTGGGGSLLEISPLKEADLSKKIARVNVYSPQTTSTNIYTITTSTISDSPYAALTSSPTVSPRISPTLTTQIPLEQTGAVTPVAQSSGIDNIMFYALLIGGGYIVYDVFLKKKK